MASTPPSQSGASDFRHLRHKPPRSLLRPREITLVVPQMQSHVNLARIVRAAGCFGITKIIALGQAKLDRRIARDAADTVELTVRRSAQPALEELRAAGFRMVGLEQATHSTPLRDYVFQRRTALLIGHERRGMDAAWLEMLDDVVEIPQYGLPHSLNVATSVAIAMYEFCSQFPEG